MLLVDVSASKEFGSRERSKAEVAAEVAAQIAFSAIANNDRVGLILFSDRVEKVVPPQQGPQARDAARQRHPHLPARRARARTWPRASPT